MGWWRLLRIISDLNISVYSYLFSSNITPHLVIISNVHYFLVISALAAQIVGFLFERQLSNLNKLNIKTEQNKFKKIILATPDEGQQM